MSYIFWRRTVSKLLCDDAKINLSQCAGTHDGEENRASLCPTDFRLPDVIIRCVPQTRNFVVGPPLPYVRRLRSARRSGGFRQVGSTRRTEASARPGWSPSYANRAYVVPESVRPTSRPARYNSPARRPGNLLTFRISGVLGHTIHNGSSLIDRSVPVNSWTTISTVCGLLRAFTARLTAPGIEMNRNYAYTTGCP